MLNYLDPTAVVDDELRRRLSDVDDSLARMSALGNVSVQMEIDRLRIATELRIAEALERIAEALAPTLRPVVELDIDPETRARLSDVLRAAEEEVGGNEGEESGPTMENVGTSESAVEALRSLAAAHPNGIPGLLQAAGVWDKPLGRGIWEQIEPFLVEPEREESGPTMEDVLTMGSEFPDDPRGDRPGVDGKD
jgi:hypothetical protein